MTPGIPDHSVCDRLEQVRRRLAAFGKALQVVAPQFQAIDAQMDADLSTLAQAIHEEFLKSGDELAAHGFMPPQTIEEWEHLARIVEIPLETVRAGELTADEIHACAMAWADRQKIRAKLTASAVTAYQRVTGAVEDRRQVRLDNVRAIACDRDRDIVFDSGGPTVDPTDSRRALWAGKRIYLGNDTEVGRLFWLLAQPVGRAFCLGDVQRAIDGMETEPDDLTQTRRASQRLRKVISKLRERLREAELDDHVLIVRGGSKLEPEYSMVWRWAK